MDAYSLAAFLHVLAFVYWLGGDLGVYYSAYFVVDPKLSPQQRATAAKIMGDLDLIPRFCLIVMVPTGLLLGNEAGWWDLPGAAIAAAFILAGVWIGLVVHLHHHASAFWRAVDMTLRAALIAGLFAAGGAIVSGSIDLPGFLGAKMLILGLIVCVGVAVRFALKPFGPAFAALLAKGASPEVDATLAGAIGRVRPMIWLIYLGVAGAAYLGSPSRFEDRAMDRPQADDGLIDALRQAAGAENVTTDPVECAVYGQDVFSAAETPPVAVVSPRDAAALSHAVAAATSRGRLVVPRGGGMSYTGGYLPARAGAVTIDLARMDRILRIDADDMVVTVEAGCTWASLHRALKPLGLRTPFWGSLSGLKATIGGSVSQNAAFFGCAEFGCSADSVVALTVVLADGTIVRTGTPFFRHYGPDLTGLFLGDAGALGFKAEIVLRLVKARPCVRYASFAFETKEALASAMSAVAREGIAAELFAFDPGLQRQRMKRASLMSDVKSLAGVVAGQGSLLKGLKEGAKVALAGRGFMDDVLYSLHMSLEGRTEAQAEAALADAREIARASGGREIENTIPKVMRADPFVALNSMVGPEGERWAPVHGIVPHSRAVEVWSAIEAIFARRAAAFDRLKIATGFLVTTVSTNGFLIEPVFYWPEALMPIHERSVEASYLSKMKRHAPNPDATAEVTAARAEIADLFKERGAAHFQIGKAYRYAEGQDAGARALLEAVKRAVDPKALVNPGASDSPKRNAAARAD